MTDTIQTALQGARKRIEAASESASLDAQVLLANVLGVDRTYLFTHPEQILTTEQAERFDALVERCSAGEPLSYLLGRRAFYDRELVVSSSVLVPRPETELLLERALNFAKAKASVTAVDVGTGSGALAVTFAAHYPQAAVYATDISPDALTIARKNADLQQVQVTFYQGDLLKPLLERDIHLDLIMANLPYIPSEEVPTLAVSKYEPLLALDGGADGLVLVRRLLTQAVQLMDPNGLTLLEIGAGQGALAAQIAQDTFPQAQVHVELDYAGLDRIVVIEHK